MNRTKELPLSTQRTLDLKEFKPTGVPKEKRFRTDVGREGPLEAKGREDVNKQGYSGVQQHSSMQADGDPGLFWTLGPSAFHNVYGAPDTES